MDFYLYVCVWWKLSWFTSNALWIALNGFTGKPWYFQFPASVDWIGIWSSSLICWVLQHKITWIDTKQNLISIKWKDFHVFMLLSAVRLTDLLIFGNINQTTFHFYQLSAKELLLTTSFPFSFYSVLPHHFFLIYCLRQQGAPADLASVSLKQLKKIRDVFGLAGYPDHKAGGTGLWRAVYFVWRGQKLCL